MKKQDLSNILYKKKIIIPTGSDDFYAIFY